MKAVFKIQLLAVAIILLSTPGYTQTGIGTLTPDASAMLDIHSTTKGLLPPRMSSTQRTGITTPAAGLVVYDSDSAALMFFNGATWTKVGSSGNISAWGLTGNTGNTAGNFIGTTDNQPLRFKVNNQPAGFISPVSTATAIGNGALQSNSVNMSSNSAFGSGALFANTTGEYNTAVGEGALTNNVTGSNNIAIGTSALNDNGDGSRNIAIGNNALLSNSTGAGSVAIGDRALSMNTVSGNTAVGTYALKESTTATGNTALGYRSQLFNVTGSGNTSVGNSALYSNSIVSNLTAVGDSALWLNGIGAQANSNDATNNTAIGSKALQNTTTGWNNTATGYGALKSNVTGTYNVANGVFALVSNTGDGNTALGTYAMNFNTTGSYNTAVGVNSLVRNLTGIQNASLGHNSLDSNTTGNYNTAVGDYAMSGNITGSKNTTLGYLSDLGAPNLTNATALGAEAVVNTSNSLVLGNNANVGIGTSSPTAKLDVVGSVKIVDGTQAAGRVLTSDANGLASWQTPAPGGGSSQWTSIGNNLVYSQGTVAVQTPSTGTSLTVFASYASDPWLPALLGATYTPSTYGVQGADHASGSAGIGVHGTSVNGTGVNGNSTYGIGGVFSTAFGSYALLTGTGNVGIGNLTPTAKLDVAGTVKIVDGTQGTGKVLTSDASGNASWQTPSGGGATGWNYNSPFVYQTDIYNGSVTLGSNNPSPTFKMSVYGGGKPNAMYLTAQANTNMALQTGFGRISFGAGTSTTEKLEVNGAIKIADASATPANGTIRYTDANGFQGYHNSAWANLSGTGGGGATGTNYAFKATTGTGTSVGIPAGTNQISFYAEAFDPENVFNDGTNTFTAPVAGVYQFSAAAYVSPSGTGDAIGSIVFKKNGNNFDGSSRNDHIHIAAPFTIVVDHTVTVQLNAGDAITANVAIGGITPSLTFTYDGTGNTNFSGFRIQ